MPTPLALLTVLILLNSACTIVNYSPSESVIKPLVETHDKRELLSFSYLHESPQHLDSDLRTLPWQSQLLKDLFEQHSRFIKVVVTTSPPAIGVHVNVYATDNPPMSPWCKANIGTISVIPCYAEGIIYQVHFDVFINNTLKQSYRYDISQKRVAWIGVLPLFWVNFFTTELKEAFSANVYQFITDAKRDGFL